MVWPQNTAFVVSTYVQWWPRGLQMRRAACSQSRGLGLNFGLDIQNSTRTDNSFYKHPTPSCRKRQVAARNVGARRAPIRCHQTSCHLCTGLILFTCFKPDTTRSESTRNFILDIHPGWMCACRVRSRLPLSTRRRPRYGDSVCTNY